MRIDSHQHFWRYVASDYPWIQPSMEVLQRDYLPSDLEPLLAITGIDGSMAVQAQQTIVETHWLLEIAAKNGIIRGVVGWAPLVRPDADAIVAELASDPWLKGIRHILHDEPDDRYMLGDDFNRGVACLAQYDLVYDVLIFARHLPAALEFVDRHPHQWFVIDHIAKPAITAARFDETWARQLRALGERPHVTCKLSGIVTEVRDRTFSADLLRPYLDTALEAFGSERLLFGTDWPVCLLRCGYADWVRTTLEYIAALSSSEQRAIMGGNAERVYRLEGPSRKDQGRGAQPGPSL
jgi:L-fucono-1,5-lactonase